MARKVEFQFDPFDLAGRDKGGFTPNQQKEIAERAAELVRQAVIDDVESSRSPVTGRQFKKLSPKYAAVKQREGRPPVPDLTLTGDMMGSLRATTRGSQVNLSVEPSQGDKADGHNNHSGESKLPERKFIPDENETFRPGIRDAVAQLIDEIENG